MYKGHIKRYEKLRFTTHISLYLANDKDMATVTMEDE